MQTLKVKVNGSAAGEMTLANAVALRGVGIVVEVQLPSSGTWKTIWSPTREPEVIPPKEIPPAPPWWKLTREKIAEDILREEVLAEDILRWRAGYLSINLGDLLGFLGVTEVELLPTGEFKVIKWKDPAN